MSKVLKVENGNYTVKVEAGHDIILDTSRSSQANGNVYVYGNLVVSGAAQQIETEDLYIKDNLITLNAGQQGSAVTGNIAGIEIDRGSRRAYFLFDEAIVWEQEPVGPIQGAFKFTNDSLVIPVQTSGIISPYSLYLQPSDVITVLGTVDYEEKVLNYANGVVVDNGGGVIRNDDDAIPNIKAVIDYVAYSFQNVGPTLISSGDTEVRILDNSLTGINTRINVTVDNSTVATIFNDRIEIGDIRIRSNTISTTASNTDLILSSPGSGTVQIDDVLSLKETPHEHDINTDPLAPADGIKLYSKTQSLGKTGLFYINKSNTTDELISNKRALAYSMIF